MRDCTTFYVDGQWVAPAESRKLEVINPATEAVAGVISLGSRADVDRAVQPGKLTGFVTWDRPAESRADRIDKHQVADIQ